MANKVFTFDDLNSEMKKHSILGNTMDKSEVSKIDEYINSGNYHLNAAMTGSLFKGYPGNRAVSLIGQSGCLIPDETVEIYIMKSKTFTTRNHIIL